MTRIHSIATGRVYSSVLAAVMLTMSAGAVSAADESIREKAAPCAPCHGEGGISKTENTPSLAGQPDLFLQWQLVFLRSGSRKNEVMQPIAEQLSNEDVRNLSAYFASLPPPKASEPDDNPDLSKKGAQAAAGRRCGSCHSDTFAGTKAVAGLAGQREEYLAKALHDYKSNLGVGNGVAAMADVTYSLSKEEITALAHYLAHLLTSDAFERSVTAVPRPSRLPCPPKRAACHVRAIVTLMYCAPGYLPLEMRAQMWFQTQLIRRQRTSTRVVVRAP